MSNEKKKIEEVVNRGVDAVIAGDRHGKVVTKENAGQLADISKDVLKGAAAGAAKGAVKGAIVGAIEGAVEAANQSVAEASHKAPVSNDPPPEAGAQPKVG